MRTQFSRICILIISFLTIVFLSCEGPEGPEGPVGPAGAAGPQGPAGEDGEDGDSGGAAGEDGQACWDLNDNGVGDPDEDFNGDGIVDVFDCQGADGQNGADGTDGVDGQDGADGTDGQDGANGQDGADGNANVASIVFDISGQAGQSFISVSVPELTEQVLAEDLVLIYLRYANNDPFEWILASGFGYNPDHILVTKLIVGEVLIELRELDGVTGALFSGDYDRLRVVIAKASTVETGKSSIDFKDYYETMDYFGLSY
ncbi:hypothetical protein [Ulvibacterium sp.]|uniref:hypothetical protein n=1 Tax=Ulvibacterium sp. TaxID=2665914 RepID=UPI003BAC261C